MNTQYKFDLELFIKVAAAIFVLVFALLPTTSFASGGSGGGGGGSGGGGSTTPTTGPAFTAFKVTAGYRPGGGNIGAVWTALSVNSVANSSGCRIHLTITDETGTVIWNSFYYALDQTIDDDNVALNSVYLVEADLIDSNGNVVESRSAVATSPKPKNGII